jgi:hypothetical protein
VPKMSACHRDKVTVTGTARGQCPPQADSFIPKGRLLFKFFYEDYFEVVGFWIVFIGSEVFRE